jgi:DNA-binding CsgD family transcriptional regulator
MLTAELDTRTTTGIVHLDINDTTLRLALSFVAEDAGWSRGAWDDATVVVSDQLHRATAERPIGILVVAPEPAACQAAVRAVALGWAGVLISADDPEQLPSALAAASSGFVLMPKRLVNAANQVPPLDDRLIRTLLLVAAHNSNGAIARAMHESESTAKRDVAVLMRLLGVRSRAGLAEAATRLGYRSASRVSGLCGAGVTTSRR